MTDAKPDAKPAKPDETAGRRQRGLDMMRQVYGWEVQDGPGDFFGLTADHLFAEIWTRPGLSIRDKGCC